MKPRHHLESHLRFSTYRCNVVTLFSTSGQLSSHGRCELCWLQVCWLEDWAKHLRLCLKSKQQARLTVNQVLCMQGWPCCILPTMTWDETGRLWLRTFHKTWEQCQCKKPTSTSPKGAKWDSSQFPMQQQISDPKTGWTPTYALVVQYMQRRVSILTNLCHLGES